MPVQDIWQEKNGKFVILWIDYFHFLNNNAQEKFLPLNQGLAANRKARAIGWDQIDSANQKPVFQSLHL